MKYSAAFGPTLLLIGALVNIEARSTQRASGVGTISGRFVTPDGRPVAGAVVTLRSGMPTVGAVLARAPSAGTQQTSGTSGEFRFDHVPPGVYSLSASHPRYLDAHYGQKFIGQSGRPIHLAAGDAFRATLTAIRGGVITGQVFDATGEPMPDVVVSAYRYRYDGMQRKLEAVRTRAYASNDIGQYRITNLPPGDFLVAGHFRPGIGDNAAGNSYAPTWYPGVVSAQGAAKVSVPAGTESSGVDFALQQVPLTYVTGKLERADGQPAPEALLFVTGATPDAPVLMQHSVKVEANGAFRLGNMPPGNYLLHAQESYQTPRTPDAIRTGGAEPAMTHFAQVPFSVQSEPIAGLLVRLRAGTGIRGRLESNTALPGAASVTFVPERQSGITRTARVVGKTEFSTMVGPGRYRVAVTGLPEGWVLERVSASGRDVTATGMTVGRETDINLLLTVSSRGAVISGRVADIGGSQDYTIVVLSEGVEERTVAGGGVRFGRPNQNGEFTVTGLRPGTYFVTALEYIDPNDAYDPGSWQKLEAQSSMVNLSLGERRSVTLAHIAR